MRQHILRATFALLLSAPGLAAAGTSVGVNVGVSNGPTTIQFSFRSQPEVIYVPEQRVYVVEDRRCDDDMFRYGDSWWVVRGDRWYRARTWRGPFSYVEAHRVPSAIWYVPDRRWKHRPHHVPPGIARRRGAVAVSNRPDVIVVKEKHGRGRGHDDHRDHDGHR